MHVPPPSRPSLARRLRWMAVGLAALGCLGVSTLPGPAAVAAPVAPSVVTDTTGWFPFPQVGSDSTETVVSANDLLIDAPGDNPATVVDRRGPVRVDSAGRFVFTNTGERVRFWGVNIGAAGAFPASPDVPPRPGEGGSPDDARALAARLAKLGFNAVRLHHLDNTWSGEGGTLWTDYANNTQDLNPDQLRRLDYFIYQLKRHGIYVNLNLHVSRQFTPADGATAAQALAASDASFNKNTTLFDPVQIELQKAFADALLNRVNPYTGLAYKDDPVIFSTETTNENSIFIGLAADQLNWYPGDPGSLPEFYDDQLDGWSDRGGSSTLNRLDNGDFADGLNSWYAYANAPAAATFTDDGGALRVAITNGGPNPWEIQFGQRQLAVKAGTSYEVSFRVRASRATTVRFNVGRDGPPWNDFGLAQTVPVGTGWTTQRFTFTANDTSFGQARMVFDVGSEGASTLWFDDVTFREASPIPGWHGWLRDRYGTTEAIRQAWAPASGGPDGQMLTNASFEAGLDNWLSQTFGTGAATFDTDATTSTDGTRSLRARVTAVTGEGWQVQVNQYGLPITAGQTYRLRFDARASTPGPMAASLQRSVSPYDGLGLYADFDLGTDWRTFDLRFTATASAADAFVSFLVGQSARTVWIDNVSFGPSSLIGLDRGESLEANSIERMPRRQWSNYTDARVRDLIAFYTKLEADYFAEMQRYLDEVIGARSLNTGTANYFDNLAHLPAMAGTDYVDNHFYWDHPSWPSGPAWAPTGWVIRNESWLNSAFEGLFDKAVFAVKGKPFTLTEIDSPAPNRYEAEAPLVIATFANLQDWDGVFKFDYVDAQRNFGTQAGLGFFALAGNPVDLALMPVAARIFLDGQTSRAPTESVLRFTPREVLDSTRSGWAGGLGGYLQEAKGVTPPAAFGSRLRVASFNEAAPRAIQPPTPAGPRYVSGGGQLTWDTATPGAARYLINAPAVKGVVGFLTGQTFDLNGLRVAVSGTPTGARANAEFGAVTLQSLTDKPLATSEELLLSVVTRFENTGMVWNPDFTSVNDNWGRAPALVEPVRLTATAAVVDASRARVWALDPTGAPRSVIPHQVVDSGRIQFTVDTGRDRTMWYYVELVRPAATGIAGTVTGPDGAPLGNVVVQSFRPQGTRWVTGPRTRTDASGRYSFPSLSPGRYRLRFTRTGYLREFHADATTLARATDITVESGRTVTVDAQLARR